LASQMASLARSSARCLSASDSSRFTSLRLSFSVFSSQGSISRIFSQMFSSSIIVISETPGLEPLHESSSS